MENRLITKHRKSGLYFLMGFLTYCIVCVGTFMYVYIFTDEVIPLIPIIAIFLIGVFVGFMLLKSEPVVEIDLDSGDVLMRLPVSLTKFLYPKNEIIGYTITSHLYMPKHPFNHTYVFIELVFFTTDSKFYVITSLTTLNFEEVLTYFYKTYPMVSDKKFKPYTEAKKDEQYRSALNQIEEDKRTFWKQKKKDLLIGLIIMIVVGLFYFLLYNCNGE
jgi:hypothetical protein